MMARARHLGRVSVIAYGTTATAMTVAVAVAGERWWPVALAGVFAGWWLTPAVGLFAVAVLRRWRLGMLCLAGAAWAWAVWYGPRFVPSVTAGAGSALGAGDGAILRVATFNVGVGRTKWKTLARVIADLDADIVGLQELTDENAELLGDALAEAYPHRFLYGGGTLGMGVLSRHPFDDVERLSSSWPGRDSLRTVVHTPAGPVTLTVAHPHQPVAVPGVNGWTAYRQDPGFVADIDRLVGAVEGRGTTLLIGDLNLPERHTAYRTLRAAGLVDAFHAAGWGFGVTWPQVRVFHGLPVPPLVRLDYIWCTPDVTPLRAWVGAEDAGSDHRPVVADVRIGR